MPFPTVHPALARAIEARGYAEPTTVQAAVADPDTAGRDMLVSAETGSGKTVAFGLAIARTLLGEAERFGEARAPRALVVAPTRELALQVERELAWLFAATGARIVSAVGGMDPKREARALSAGAHVVVGTPGRLRDHIERGRLVLSNIDAVVLDEADEMLDLGFREDLAFILDGTPAERQTLLFSATLPAEVVRLARSWQRDALAIDTIDSRKAHADIEYRALRVSPAEIEKAVVNVLLRYDARASLVFCATRERVRSLAAALEARGFEAVALSGEMGQGERNEALAAIRDGRARVCVATDVAARGIDVADLSLVVHADLPNDREALLHRSGRTGRAGRKGAAVLIVPHTRRRKAEGLLAHAGLQATWSSAPGAEEIRAAEDERLVADPIFSRPADPADADLVRRLAEGHDPEALAAALVALWRRGRPRPERIFEAPRRAEQPAAAAADGGTGVWFRLGTGRRDGLDVRHLLAMICRIGGVDRREVGSIRLADEETLFEAAAGSVVAFDQAAAAGEGARLGLARIAGAPPAPVRTAPRPAGRKPHPGVRPARALPPHPQRASRRG